MTDPVKQPSHYTAHPSGVECIDITRHMGFCLGNAIKYIWRADLKNDALEDLRKAIQYLEFEIETREKKQDGEVQSPDVPGVSGGVPSGIFRSDCFTSEIKFAGTDGYLVNRRTGPDGEWSPGDEVEVFPVTLGGPASPLREVFGDDRNEYEEYVANQPRPTLEVDFGGLTYTYTEPESSHVESVLPDRRQGCCE